MIDLERYVSPSAAARTLRLSEGRVRQLLRAGQLPHLVTPLGRLVDGVAVRELVERRAGGEHRGEAG